MRILLIHADYVEYETKERTPVAEEISKDRKKGSLENPLIAFISVESVDEDSTEEKTLIKEALEEIIETASKIKAENIALFPFAHLSEDLASPDFAVDILKRLESRLENSGFNSIRVPFGWYKEFEFRNKGHPLSVLSKSLPS